MTRTVRILVPLVLALALASACRRGSVAMTTTTPVLLPSEQDPEELRAAIVRALEARRFTPESEQPGRIVARYDHRGQMLALAIDYTASDYRIHYMDSAGLGYRQRPDGSATISPHYDRHVDRLRRTIADEIERPEREAAEAAERERQHQIALAEQERQREREARDAEARERQRQRDVELERERQATERERLRTERARAEAEARRPIIIGHDPSVVASLELAPRRARARFETVNVRDGARARWITGQAEGRVDASQLGLPSVCRGHFEGRPEHVLRVRGDVPYLRLETDSADDPTLVVVAADGTTWCDDDGGEGLNSRIEGEFPAGTYRVFVGSYRPNSVARYRLLVTQTRAAVEARVDVQPAPAPQRTCRQMVIEYGHHPAHAVHCEGVDPACAESLLRAGRHPAHLVHCRR